MFEKEIKFIADFSLNRIKNLGSFFTFEKLAAADIHPAIIRYISAELDYLIYEDRRKLLQQSVFDYSGPEINKLFGQINDQIKKTKKISYEDIKKLVIQAVSFNINFVARPKWSLAKLVYNTADVKTVDEIKMMLNYIYFYDYLKNIVMGYLTKRNIVTLSLIEFELLLSKIDKEVFIPSQAKELIDNAIYAMADIFSIGGRTSSRISPAPIEIFLKEKNLIDYLFRLRRSLPPSIKSSFEVEELRKVIYSSTPIDQQTILQEEVDTEEQVLKDMFNAIQDEDVLLNNEIDKQFIMSEPEEQVRFTEENEVPPIDDLEEVPEEVELKNDELIIDDPEAEFLKLYDEQLKELENDSGNLTADIDEVKFDIEKKEELGQLYEFEDEPTAELGMITEEEERMPEPLLSEEHEEELYLDEEETTNEDSFDIQDEKFDAVLNESFRKLDIPSEISADDFVIEHHDNKEIINEIPFVTVPEEKKEHEAIPLTKDLFSYFSDKDIDKIVNNVFNEDREDFTSTMERVTECNTYDEATEIIKGVFLSYRVNPYSRDAVTLTNAVSNYFNQV